MPRRVILGATGGGSLGMKVSRPGIDADLAGNTDLVFNSDWAQYGVVHASGTLFSGGNSAASASASFPDLGFTPLVSIVPLNGAGQIMPYGLASYGPFTPNDGPTTLVYPIVMVNRTTITLLGMEANTGAFGVRYIVFGVPVSDSFTDGGAYDGGAPPPPTINFSASPTSITLGASSTLSWTTSNASSVIIAGVGTFGPSGSVAVSPTATTTYTATATGTANNASATATVTVTTPPPTISFSASPTAIAPGQSSTLTWSTTNATSVTIAGVGTFGPSGSVSVTPGATTTYTATASGVGGSNNASATVTVTANPAPTISFSASPTTIGVGSSSTLSWTTTNATSVTIAGVGTFGASGSVSVSPGSTTTYNATASGAGGSAGASATVTVVPAPTISFSATPSTITVGQSSTLSWSTTNATSVNIPGVGNFGPSGSVSVSPTATTTYSATATGLGGSAGTGATVTVTAAGPDVTPNAVNWANTSNFDFADTAATISGISQTISLRITLSGVNITGSSSRALRVYVGGVQVVQTSGPANGTNLTFNVSNGQQVIFEFQCVNVASAANLSGTATVTNQSDGGVVLDTFTFFVSAAQ